MLGSVSFLRQLSEREGWKSTSRRWGGSGNRGCEGGLRQMEGLNMYGRDNGGLAMRKRVMVVVDHTAHSKQAMMWALTHVANKSDLLTLLQIIPASVSGSGSASDSSSSWSPSLANSLATLCRACRPEVEVEALVIQGPKLSTVLSQVKKLEVSVLVLGQKKPSSIFSCLRGSSSTEEFVEKCINNAECLTFGVRKQRSGMGGYLISSRWQKNFWLLA